MSDRQNFPLQDVARKWLALAERRYAHFIELSETGRWKHYYTHPQFELEIRKAYVLCEQWAVNAGLVPEGHQQAAE
jgi:hypothetical protein